MILVELQHMLISVTMLSKALKVVNFFITRAYNIAKNAPRSAHGFNESDAAVAFDTGYIDMKYLGINSKHKFNLRRWAICAPMIKNPPRPAYQGSTVLLPVARAMFRTILQRSVYAAGQCVLPSTFVSLNLPESLADHDPRSSFD